MIEVETNPLDSKYSLELLIEKSVNQLNNGMYGPNEGQRTKLLEELQLIIREYEVALVTHPAVRMEIYQIYNKTIDDRYSIAPLSRNFNKSKKGEAKELADHIELTMKAARASEGEGNSFGAACFLTEAKLNYDIILSEDLHKLAGGDDYLEKRYNRIKEIRDTLFRSAIGLACHIAFERKKNVSWDLLQEEDLFQEAAVNLIIAINKYVPQDSDDYSASFISYVSSFMRHNVGHHIAENTRTVRIPRMKIDRSRPLWRALRENVVGDLNDDKLAERATELSEDEYTASEVEELRRVYQQADSIDAVVTVDDYGHPATLGEILPEPMLPDADLDLELTNERMTNIIGAKCNDNVERLVVRYRWGLNGRKMIPFDGRPVGWQTVSRLIKRDTGNHVPVSRLQVLEAAVLDRVKSDPDTLAQLAEVYSVLLDYDSATPRLQEQRIENTRCGCGRLSTYGMVCSFCYRNARS